MALLRDTGLAQALHHLEIHVAGGEQPLPFMLPRTRRITFHDQLETAENNAMRDVWQYSQHNPGHRVLWFHSIGLSHRAGVERERKHAWGKFLAYCNINLWSQCQSLLDFYDCVGADYINYASFGVPHTRLWAPHYSGNFWWANTNYIRRLDPGYLEQDVPWRRYLAELWIGSGHPRAFMMQATDINPYVRTMEFDPLAIQQGVDQHLRSRRENRDRY